MVRNMDTTTIIIIICILVIVGFTLYMETRLQNNSGNCIDSHYRGYPLFRRYIYSWIYCL